MSSEVSTPTAKRRLGSCGEHVSQTKEVKDEYVPWPAWVEAYQSGARVGYFNVHRNNQRYRFKIASTSEASSK